LLWGQLAGEFIEEVDVERLAGVLVVGESDILVPAQLILPKLCHQGPHGTVLLAVDAIILLEDGGNRISVLASFLQGHRQQPRTLCAWKGFPCILVVLLLHRRHPKELLWGQRTDHLVAIKAAGHQLDL
jgi:hypothetical protein